MSGVHGWIVLGGVLVGLAALAALAFWPGMRSISEMDEGDDRGDLDGSD